jgi:hypothetical protein
MEDHTLFVPFERGPFEDRLSMTVPTEGCSRVGLELALLEGAVEVVLLASEGEAQWTRVGDRWSARGPSCTVRGPEEIRAPLVRVDLVARGRRAVITGGGLRLTSE